MKKKGQAARIDREPASVPASASRFIGIHLGGFALAGTYLVAVVRGVSAPAALWRAAVAFAVAFVLGRILGFVLGRVLLEPPPPVQPAVQPVNAEPGP